MQNVIICLQMAAASKEEGGRVSVRRKCSSVKVTRRFLLACLTDRERHKETDTVEA